MARPAGEAPPVKRPRKAAVPEASPLPSPSPSEEEERKPVAERFFANHDCSHDDL